MKFPRNIEVDGYREVTVVHGAFVVSIRIDAGEGEDEMELALYASESKALRKALKAAEALLTAAHLPRKEYHRMTTTEATPELTDIYSHDQIARMAALQGVASFAKGIFGTTNPGVLIELAEYVIGDDEPFDPVAEAHKAMAAIGYERGEDYNGYDDGEAGWTDEDEDYDDYDAPFDQYEDGPMAEWERQLLEGDITVSDLAGFDTLPGTAVLMDVDGDEWYYAFGRGWTYAGSYIYRSVREIFSNLGGENGEFDFIVTNPEVLS